MMEDPGTPYRLEMRADSLSSTEEVRHLSTSTSRGVFPSEYICERDPVFMVQVKWTPRYPDKKEVQISLQRLHACSSFISQDERMSESPVENLEKALGLHFISKMGLTCLWQLENHVEFTASNFDDAWQFFNIVRIANITVSNTKRNLDSHLTSRSVCIFLPRLVYIPELSLIPRHVPDFNEKNWSFEWTSPL